MRIVNRIPDCDDGEHKSINLKDRRLLVFHRCGLGETAEDIAASFQTIDATGGQMPYSFVIKRDGTIEQALPVGDYGPHARKWNTFGIGVAVVGDFRSETPTIMQWDAAIRLCVSFAGWATDGIKGHDELPGGSSDGTKRCPGPMFDMELLRDSVHDAVAQRLYGAGIIF